MNIWYIFGYENGTCLLDSAREKGIILVFDNKPALHCGEWQHVSFRIIRQWRFTRPTDRKKIASQITTFAQAKLLDKIILFMILN